MVAPLSDAVRELYPWTGKYLRISEGVRMHYLDEGHGETLLMLHGNPTWSFYWRNMVKEFSKNYRCIVPDHIGCGLSDKPEEYRYQLEDHVNNLVQLIEALDLSNITLVVHDWGGPIGFSTALRLRERFRRFVVFNTLSRMGPFPLSIRMLRWPMVGPFMVRGLNGFVRFALRKGTSRPERFKGAVAEGYLAPYNNWKNRIAIQKFVDDIPIEAGHPTEPYGAALEQQIPELSDRPHLVIWGNQDFVFHHYFRDGWKAAVPNGEFHQLDHANHFVVEDAFEDIVPLMRDFLDRHPIQPER
jgi:cis-3-alkyl-4-acyloxetan-2-one decarboxylase